MTSSGDQGAYRLRCDWGPDGGAVIASGADVCSFTTTSVALDRGIAVITSAERAGPPGVVVAGRRAEGGLSLSPVSVRAADPAPAVLDTSSVVPILVDGVFRPA